MKVTVSTKGTFVIFHRGDALCHRRGHPEHRFSSIGTLRHCITWYHIVFFRCCRRLVHWSTPATPRLYLLPACLPACRGSAREAHLFRYAIGGHLTSTSRLVVRACFFRENTTLNEAPCTLWRFPPTNTHERCQAGQHNKYNPHVAHLEGPTTTTATDPERGTAQLAGVYSTSVVPPTTARP